MKNNNKSNPYSYQHKPISGKMFHAPENYGEIRRIPMSPAMHILSAASLLVQLALTAFAVYAAHTQPVILPLQGSGISSGLLYLFLPGITWMLTIGFRLACRIIPLEMWRLSKRVQKGMILCEGTLLKTLTLLVELETAICFVYIALALYFGQEPHNLILFLWILVLFFSIFFPCRKAIQLAEADSLPRKPTSAK